jgi:Mrp family chromosome partitioning ATPase
VDKDPSRFVVLDLAPVLGAGDALAVLPAVDAVLMVVDDDRTSVDDLAAAERLLDGLPLIGIALNRSRGAASARMRPRS